MSTAAAAAAFQRQEEEEAMTGYSAKDLAEHWEFKMVRSTFSTFRDPARLRHMVLNAWPWWRGNRPRSSAGRARC